MATLHKMAIMIRPEEIPIDIDTESSELLSQARTTALAILKIHKPTFIQPIARNVQLELRKIKLCSSLAGAA